MFALLLTLVLYISIVFGFFIESLFEETLYLFLLFKLWLYCCRFYLMTGFEGFSLILSFLILSPKSFGMGRGNVFSLKPEKFCSSEFARWQETLDLISVIKKDPLYLVSSKRNSDKTVPSASSYIQPILDKSL